MRLIKVVVGGVCADELARERAKSALIRGSGLRSQDTPSCQRDNSGKWTKEDVLGRNTTRVDGFIGNRENSVAVRDWKIN